MDCKGKRFSTKFFIILLDFFYNQPNSKINYKNDCSFLPNLPNSLNLPQKMRIDPSQYPSYFQRYIELVEGIDLHSLLPQSFDELKVALLQIPVSKADYAYASGKWTVKQVLQHCIDTERIFAYRALCISRDEQQHLPGFDQDYYIQHANLQNKSLEFLKEEMLIARQSTLMLFQHFTDTELSKKGIASEHPITVLALGYIIVAHWMHHQRELTEKYGIIFTRS